MGAKRKTISEELKGTVGEIITQLRDLIRKGNARRLIITNRKGNILFQTQLTAGLAGTAFIVAIAPTISAITMFLLFANKVSVIVETYSDPDRDEGGVSAADVVEVEGDETK